MFDVIDRLKSEWTDKYVVIDSSAPELARFAAATGIVKTVNMNGRCLVQFDQFNNIGWYDIDPSCLKIVPKPLPKPAESKPKAAAAPAKAAPSPKPAPAKPAAGAKPSTADILAAARSKAAAPAKPAGRPSTAEILAAARAKKADGAAVEAPAPQAVAAEVPPEPVAATPAKVATTGPLPKTTAEIIAWCRARDAKS